MINSAPATILIVDDEIQNRHLLEALLKPEGYLTLSAANGEEALALIAKSPPDLILLDVMMPGLDGYHVATQLKANPETSNIPIILVTALAERSARLQGLNAGAEEFLTKPVDRGELWLRVRNLLRLKAYNDFLQNHSEILEKQVRLCTADLQRFRTAMDASTDAIMLVDRASMSFIHVNDAACAIHNQDRESLLELGPMDVLSSSREELEHSYDAIIASGVSAKPVDILHRRKDGSDVWVELRCYAQCYDKKWTIVNLWRDITERKVAEDEIRCLNGSLEQRVAARTAQLAFANDELETFSYSVSHDLRAPIRQVQGFVALLQEEAGASLSESSLRYLATISRSAKRMDVLIEDLLSFSFVGRTELQKAKVDLNQVAQEVLADFDAEIIERHCVLVIHSLPIVWADQALLRLVLINLVSNAIKFSSARSDARIEIGCATEKNGETIIFVRDNGAGFDQKYADKLFGVFQRLHSQSEFEGTGIGLANVQRIIDRHDGRVWANGVVGSGACFYFSLPNKNAISQRVERTGDGNQSRRDLSELPSRRSMLANGGRS